MKKYRVSLALTMLSVLLFGVSSMVGTSVNGQGVLVEPAFFCIPLAYLSLLCAVLVGVGVNLRHT